MGTFREAAGEVAEPGGPITVVRSSGLESSTIAQPTRGHFVNDSLRIAIPTGGAT